MADIIEERARNTAKRFSAKAYYLGHKELLERNDIDAVIVSTGHPTHSLIAVEALESGKHVLI